MYYIVYIFQMAGINGNRGLISGAIQYCISVGVQVISFTFMDHYRRRWALMAGSMLLATWLFAAAGLMANYGHAVPGGLNGVPSVTWVVDSDAASKAVISCAYLFVASYALTWGYATFSPTGDAVLTSLAGQSAGYTLQRFCPCTFEPK